MCLHLRERISEGEAPRVVRADDSRVFLRHSRAVQQWEWVLEGRKRERTLRQGSSGTALHGEDCSGIGPSRWYEMSSRH